MRIHKVEEWKNLLTAEVMKGQETPYYYRGDGSTEAFIRIGNESVVANAAELKRLVLRGKNTSFDSLMTDYDFSDYSFSKLRERFKEWNGTSMSEKSFESFGIVDEKGKLTNAGALLADNSPIRYSRLFCTRWNGLDKSGGQIDALDSAEYENAANYQEGMEPEFYSDGVAFMVTLKNLNYQNKALNSEALNRALNENEEKVVLLIQDNPQITQVEIKEQLQMARSHVQKIMKSLIEKNIIERVGSKKTGYWEVKK